MAAAWMFRVPALLSERVVPSDTQRTTEEIFAAVVE